MGKPAVVLTLKMSVGSYMSQVHMYLRKDIYFKKCN